MVAVVALGSLAPALAVVHHGRSGRIGALVVVVEALMLALALSFIDRPAARRVVSIVVVALGVVASMATIGGTPAVVVALAVGVAHAAMTPQRLPGAVPGRPPLVLAIVLVVAAQAAWYLWTEPLVTCAGLAAAAAVLLAAVLVPDSLAALDGALWSGARRVGTDVVASVVAVLVLVVIGIPARAVSLMRRVVPSRADSGRAGSGWVDPRASLRTTRGFSPRPFGPSTAWHLGLPLVAVALVVTVIMIPTPSGSLLRGDTATTSAPPSSTTTDAPESGEPSTSGESAMPVIPALAEQADVESLVGELGELSTVPSPVGGIALEDHVGALVNVLDGERLTTPPDACDCRPIDVWVVGGSQAFGLGQRDSRTIASELVEAGAADGVTMVVRNFAVPGMTLWQEYQVVIERLSRSAPPDVIVFYSGTNDVNLSVALTVAGAEIPQPLVADDATSAALHEAAVTDEQVSSSLAAAGGAEAVGRRAAERYEGLRALIERQLTGSGIDVAFFFPPDALASEQQAAQMGPADQVMPAPLVRPAAAARAAAADDLRPEVTDLRHLLDQEQSPVFIDPAHINEAAAAPVAAAVYDAQRDTWRNRFALAASDPTRPVLHRVPAAGQDGSLDPITLRADKVADAAFPTAVAQRPGTDDLYVAERAGTVAVVADATAGGSSRASRTVLDISSRTTTDANRGLLGIAFSPDGSTLYLSHTDADGDAVLASYRMRAGRPDRSTREELLSIPMPFDDHNGGAVHVDGDGDVWLAMGDGGGWKDPGDRAQDPKDLRGKILRLDPDDPSNVTVVAAGLRNPFRFSIDRSTGDLWIGDVGQESIEEVNVLPRGARAAVNFGWSGMEGSAVMRRDRIRADAVAPVLEHRHEQGWCAVVGGVVYRGRGLPSAQGAYLYGDVCTGELRALRLVEGRVVADRSLGVEVPTLISIDQDQSGEVWLVSGDGGVYRLVADD